MARYRKKPVEIDAVQWDGTVDKQRREHDEDASKRGGYPSSPNRIVTPPKVPAGPAPGSTENDAAENEKPQPAVHRITWDGDHATFHCDGDQDSSCRNYPDCGCEVWTIDPVNGEHDHPSVPQAECWKMEWLTTVGAEETWEGGDSPGPAHVDGPIVTTWDGDGDCLLWDYYVADPDLPDDARHLFDAIRARAAAATPGPWTVLEQAGRDEYTGVHWAQVAVDFGAPKENAGLVMADHENVKADAEFIAHAPCRCGCAGRRSGTATSRT